MKRHFACVLFAGLVAGVPPSFAAGDLWQRLDSSLTAGVEYRYFPHEPLDERQRRHYASIALQSENYLSWDDRAQSFTLTLFGRADSKDNERSHGDVREAFYRFTARDLEWRIGVRKVFWGVTESVHLVDVINQTDLVEDIDGENKLGQPMVNLAWFSELGTIDFFLLPYFRERTFSAPDGRPRTLLPVATDRTRYRDPDERHNLGVAVRYFKGFGPMEVGLYYFHGTDREPLFDFGFDSCTVTATFEGPPLLTPGPQTGTCANPPSGEPPPLVTIDEVRVDAVNPVFVPVYDEIQQIGLDAQYIRGGLLLKLESIYQDAPLQDFAALAAGFEYSFYGVFGSAVDIGVLAEYLYDSRGQIEPEIARVADRIARSSSLSFRSLAQVQAFQAGLRPQDAAAFQDDLFLGSRFLPNDIQGTQILAGTIFDLETDAVFTSLEASRRVGSSMRLSFVARLFSQVPARDPLFGYGDDDHIKVVLQRFF